MEIIRKIMKLVRRKSSSEKKSESAQVMPCRLYKLGTRGEFTLEQASRLVPTLERITSRYHRLKKELELSIRLSKKDWRKAQRQRERLNVETAKWGDQVRRLGCLPLSVRKIEIPGKNGKKHHWEYSEEAA